MVSGLSEILQGGVVACPINNISYLKKFRKELRNKLTPAEAKLWTYLQNSTLDGRKFRRHHSVANFILDFYCPAESLAIDLDGEIHYNPTQAEYDRERDLFLNAKGIKIIRVTTHRFWNEAEQRKNTFPSGAWEREESLTRITGNIERMIIHDATSQHTSLRSEFY